MEERSPPGQAGPPLVEFRLHDGSAVGAMRARARRLLHRIGLKPMVR